VVADLIKALIGGSNKRESHLFSLSGSQTDEIQQDLGSNVTVSGRGD